MALAYVLDRLSKDPNVRLTNYAEFLELHPPEWEAEIHDNSSWSCVHGVERWRSDCGCNSGRGWHQKWRGPLRDALNQLKGRLDEIYTQHAESLFADPWAARDGYVSVILDRKPETVHQFLAQFGRPNLSEEQVREALWLTEMQRHGLLMFTSCGWFFDELSGLETVQCLRYAARAIQLARHFQAELEDDFVKILEKAPSNLPEYKNGRVVWENLVQPQRIDFDRVLAHYAIGLIYRDRQEHDRVYCYDLETIDQDVQSRGNTHVALGRLRVRSRLTWNEAETGFLVLHFGGLDFHAVLRKAGSQEEYDAIKKKLLELYATGSMADVTAFATEEFKGVVYRVSDLFLEEQRRVIGIVLGDRFAEYRQTFDRLAEPDEDVVHQLGRLRYPIPRDARGVHRLVRRPALAGNRPFRQRREPVADQAPRRARQGVGLPAQPRNHRPGHRTGAERRAGRDQPERRPTQAGGAPAACSRPRDSSGSTSTCGKNRTGCSPPTRR